MEAARSWFLDGVSRFLGLTYDRPGVARLEVTPDLLNAAGLLSGPVPYALVDYAMGSAVWEQLTEDEGCATLTLAITYLGTARSGEIVCTAAVDRRNRTGAALRAEVRTVEDDKLLATATGSFSIFPRSRYGEGGPPPGVTPVDFR